MKRLSFHMASMALAIGFLSAPAFADGGEPLNMCVGGAGGKYYEIATKVFGPAVSFTADLKPITTGGSMAELEKLGTSECDAALVQSDSLDYFSKVNSASLDVDRVAVVGKEYVHLVCNKNSGIESVKDLGPNNNIILGTSGSGAETTWKNWGTEDDSYTKIKTTILPDGSTDATALAKVMDGRDAQCMMFVAAPGSKRMMTVNEIGKGKLTLVAVDDWDFNDTKDPLGNLVYSFADMPKNTYSNLQPGGWINATGPETTVLDTVLVVRKSWAAKNPQASDALTMAALRYSSQQDQ